MPETAPSAGGVLLVDKASGPTSHDVVGRARRALGQERIGHTGTLDPFATGLLLLLVGPATRLAEYFHRLDKAYRATIRLGEETDTLDRTGRTVGTSDEWRERTDADVRAALAEFRGEILQRPPAYSAKRVDGRRAHEMARAGEEVELEPEPVIVHELELIGWEPPEATVRTVVGTGTYLRSLARDVGRELGVGAHLRELRRTRIGPFGVGEALPDSELEPGVRLVKPHGRRPAAGVSWLPRRELAPDERGRVEHGQRVERGRIRSGSGGEEPGAGDPVALVDGDRLVAVAELVGDELQPRKVFHVR